MQGSDPCSNCSSSKIVVGSASWVSQTGGPHHPCLYPCCSHSSKFILFWSLVVFGGCLRMLVVQIVLRAWLRCYDMLGIAMFVSCSPLGLVRKVLQVAGQGCLTDLVVPV